MAVGEAVETGGGPAGALCGIVMAAQVAGGA